MIIHRRFCGPPESGNGGYSAGLLGRVLDGPAQVTLRVPPPLDRPLRIAPSEGGGVRLLDGEAVVAEAVPAHLDLQPPTLPDLAAAAAADGGPGWIPGHPFPTCFVCGPGRAEHDGLRIFPGPAGGLYATTWTPDAGLAAADGRVLDEMVWAALDCPSWAPMLAVPDRPRTLVLGRLTADLRAPLRAGETYVVASWPIAHEGRKFDMGSALADGSGTVLAIARARWIALVTG